MARIIYFYCFLGRDAMYSQIHIPAAEYRKEAHHHHVGRQEGMGRFGSNTMVF